MAKSVNNNLTIEAVKDLGRVMIEVADKFPAHYLTEMDFFPLVWGYLSGRVPNTAIEYTVKGGDIDFRTGGTNPSLIEIAVAPRELKDARDPNFVFPGHKAAPQLYASQNRSELKKLFSVSSAKARNRYLLLIDFRDSHNLNDLTESYKKEAKKIKPKRGSVSIIYVSHSKTKRVSLEKKKRKRKAKKLILRNV